MFKKTKSEPITEPTEFPTGSVVKTEKGTFFIKGQLRLRIKTDAILASWNFPRIIDAKESAVHKYVVSGPLPFRDGSIIKNFADGKTYFVSAGKLRHIKSPHVLKRLGATENDIWVVSDAEIRLHTVGEEIE